MQALLQAIATVQVRIQAHGSIYANSELQTRYGLIDPILRALEWDISNPEEVQVDCTAGSGKADYVLMSQSNPHIVIEAKALKMMNSNCVSQGSAYCSALGASVLVCTDGETWSIYQAPNFIQSATVNLSEDDIFQIVCFLILLYNRAKLPNPIQSNTSTTSAPSSHMTLVQFAASLTAGGHKPPFQIIFPGSYSTVTAKTFKGIFVETVRYLDSIGKIPTRGIQKVRGFQMIVVPAGTPLQNPARFSRVGSWDVHTRGSAGDMVQNAIDALQVCGVNPNTVTVYI
jgi:hypothetical protein